MGGFPRRRSLSPGPPARLPDCAILEAPPGENLGEVVVDVLLEEQSYVSRVASELVRTQRPVPRTSRGSPSARSTARGGGARAWRRRRPARQSPRRRRAVSRAPRLERGRPPERRDCRPGSADAACQALPLPRGARTRDLRTRAQGPNSPVPPSILVINQRPSIRATSMSAAVIPATVPLLTSMKWHSK